MSMDEPEEGIITRDDGEVDIEDEVQDWKALNKLSKGAEVIPKRGEKDFEPDGTSVQTSLLDDSRNAMYQALSHPRGHNAKQELIAVWIPKENKALVPHAKGGFFKDMGRAVNFGDKIHGLWLSPIETVYLVERGSLLVYLTNNEFEEFLSNDQHEFNYQKLDSLSLSHLYTLLFDGNRKSIERYQVFAYLKRHGYLIQDFRQLDDESQYSKFTKYLQGHTLLFKTIQKSVIDSVCSAFALPFFKSFYSIFQRIGLFAYPPYNDLHFKTKHYFNYSGIFRSLKLIPSYSTYDSLYTAPKKDPAYTIDFNIWKPKPSFSKKNPPMPDFQVCVINTNITPFPKLQDIHGLLNEINYRFPEKKLTEAPKVITKPKKPTAPTKRELKLQRQKERQSRLDPKIQSRNAYLKLRDNKFKFGSSNRSIILALVQDGVINFMNIGEGDFALENFTTDDLTEIQPRLHHGIVWNEKF